MSLHPWREDTALEVGGDFLDVVFETLEGGDVAGEDHHAVADEAGFVGTRDFTVDDIGTGDVATLEMWKTWRTSTIAVISSLTMGLSMPSMASLTSSMAS